MAALSKLTWIGFAAAAAMVIGAFGPWAKTIGLVNISVSGTDGGRDGWGVVVAAAIGALALLAWEKRNRLFAIATILTGGASTVLCFTDRQDVTGIDTETELASIDVGWGLNLAGSPLPLRSRLWALSRFSAGRAPAGGGWGNCGGDASQLDGKADDVDVREGWRSRGRLGTCARRVWRRFVRAADGAGLGLTR